MHLMRGQPGQNARPQARLPANFLWHGCMGDLATGGNFDLEASWVIAMLGFFSLTCYRWLFVQPGTGRRPVDWCRN